MKQKVKDQVWIDESGKKVPVEYVTPSARLRERHAATILKEAMLINYRLSTFKTLINKLCNEVFTKALNELNADAADSKGNITWYNFDRSIKVEVKINDRIEFDDITINACKGKLDEFLSQALDSKTEFLKDMVTEAFSTSKGRLDSKKVMSLTKYRSKIQNPLFQEALNLLEDSIRRPDSKTYFRVWEREPDGSYKNVELNFSSI